MSALSAADERYVRDALAGPGTPGLADDGRLVGILAGAIRHAGAKPILLVDDESLTVGLIRTSRAKHFAFLADAAQVVTETAAQLGACPGTQGEHYESRSGAVLVYRQVRCELAPHGTEQPHRWSAPVLCACLVSEESAS